MESLSVYILFVFCFIFGASIVFQYYAETVKCVKQIEFMYRPHTV